jgi:hypothetical protein
MMKLLSVLILFLICFGQLDAQSFYDTERLKINTRDFNEFGPVMLDSSLYFCSDRKNSYTKNAVENERVVYRFDVYMVQDTAKMRAMDLPFELNSFGNDGPLCFSPDGKELYVSQNFTAKPEAKTITQVGIYQYKKQDEKWGEKTPFRHNNTDWNTGHPCLSPDGKTLYFSSDRPGGLGGFDIYFCQLENGVWSDPVNIGSPVNSAKNEITPFAHTSQRLYFASDRDSVNGFDIYSAVANDNGFSLPEKLTEPINSKFNDFSFICNASGEAGFFASNRQKSDDIYSFRSTFPDFETCDSIQTNNYCFTFFEENTRDLDSLALTYEWDFGDTKLRKKEADYCFPGPGNYDVNLNIIDSVTGEFYENQASYNMVIEDVVQPVITAPEAIKAGIEVVFDSDKSNLPDFEVQGYYWRFSDGFKSTGPQVSHLFEKPGQYKVWLGVILKDTANQTTLKKCVFVDVVVK